MSSAKGQTAVEYLMIIALTLGILVPATYLFFNYGVESTTKITDAQITQIGTDMIDTAENVYFSGDGSRIVLEVNMPDNIDNISIIDERELVFELTTRIGINEAVFFSKVNITSGNCSSNTCSLQDIAGTGLKSIRFQSVNSGKEVLISKLES